MSIKKVIKFAIFYMLRLVFLWLELLFCSTGSSFDNDRMMFWRCKLYYTISIIIYSCTWAIKSLKFLLNIFDFDQKILDFWVNKSKMLLKCVMFLKCGYLFEVQILILTSGELFENIILLVRYFQCWPTLKNAASSRFEKSKSSSKFFQIISVWLKST